MKGAPYCTCTLNTPIYHRDIDGGALGMANDNGTIIVDKDINSKQEKKVIKHEQVHLTKWKEETWLMMKHQLLGKVKDI